MLFCLLGAISLVAALVVFTFEHSNTHATDSIWVKCGLILLALSLAGDLVIRICCKSQMPGFWSLVLLHGGLLLCLIGFGLNDVAGEKGFVYIREGESATFYVDQNDEDIPLPFAIKLEDFHVSVYPKSLRVKDYVSNLEIIDGQDGLKKRLTVNSVLEYRGYRFYQQDYGLSIGHKPLLVLQVTSQTQEQGSEEKKPSTTTIFLRMQEPEVLKSGLTVTVQDFIPTAIFHDGQIENLKNNAMLNPAYLVKVQTPEGSENLQWVMPADLESEVVAGNRFHFEDFRGIEYTVLSMVKSPWDPLVNLGFIFASLGCLGLFQRLRGKSA